MRENRRAFVAIGLAIVVTIVCVVMIVVREWGPTFDWVGIGVVVVLRATAHVVEAVALLYGGAFMVAAIRYVLVQRRAPAAEPDHQRGITPCRAAVLYLCCGDLEVEALESLSRLEYEGDLIHLLHDDSTDARQQLKVDQTVAAIESRLGVQWRVLRRPEKGGGKSAVTNFVLEQTASEHDLLLLADNDSFARDRQLLQNAAPIFEDESVSIVQFRNRAEHRADEGTYTRLLGGAIEIFEVFMTGLYRGLWQPFLGHNAILRTQDVVDAGGFTPGVFADDIDLTVRLNRNGKRVVYRRDLEMTECHPPNYRSFCARSQKWSTGCAQVMRMHGLRVLFDRQLSLRQKLGFFLFCGFYLTQAAILAYAAIVLLLLPILTDRHLEPTGFALVVLTIFPIMIFLPVIAYLRMEGRHLPFWSTLGVCAATYGSTDWWTLRGLINGFSGRSSPWVPTNNVSDRDRLVSDWAHFSVGVAALAVPWFFMPEYLMFTFTWLFAAKFIFVPVVAAYYREETVIEPRERTARFPRLAMSIPTAAAVAGVIVALGIIGAARAYGQDAPLDTTRVEIDGRALLIDGEPVILKGIHYSPWTPGTGPGKGFSYPEESHLRRDLEMIRQTGANTILTFDPSIELVRLAHEYELNLIYTFNIEWWKLPAGKLGEIRERIVSRVSELRDEPAIIAWMLGNEVLGWVIDEMGAHGVRAALGNLREGVREIDPARPVCHGNRARHRRLGLDDDMDIVAYNIYPFYPTEVITQGYEHFVTNEILPLADGRPLLISEFGLNTLEASEARQAEILKDCWTSLLAAGCQGGIVFEFADEWWKNYDNPVQAPDWWRRKAAPNDHLQYDDDPEENYGIVTTEREPKLAYATIREMFGATDLSFEPVPTPALDHERLIRHSAWWTGGVAILGLVAVAIVLWWRANTGRTAWQETVGSES